jgi:transcription antitermination factor NusG
MTRIRRHRLLPLTGRVLVRKGQNVAPIDVIAEAQLEPRHRLLDIARGLGLGIGEADKNIQREAGETVSEGDVLAGPVGWGKRVVRAPCTGKIILTGRGKMLIEEDRAPYQLLAGLPGEVISLIPGRGAVVESIGALVQGVWGNGQVNFGLLRILIKNGEDILTVDQLDIDLRESVVFAGYCGDEQVLRIAAELPLRGLILSSMAASLIPLAEEISLPIVVIEGFGLLPINSAAFNLLITSDQREIAVNAEKMDTYANQRPEVFISLPVNQMVHEPRDATLFSPGQKVRIVRAPYQSQIGTLITLKPELEVLPNGIKATSAEIELENSIKVKLPLANLEVLE